MKQAKIKSFKHNNHNCWREKLSFWLNTDKSHYILTHITDRLCADTAAIQHTTEYMLDGVVESTRLSPKAQCFHLLTASKDTISAYLSRLLDSAVLG